MTNNPTDSSSSTTTGQKVKSVRLKCRVCPIWEEYAVHPQVHGKPCPMCDGVGLGLRSAHVELVVMDPGGEGFNSIDTVRELLQWYDHVVLIRERHVRARARMEELILKHDSKK